MVKIINNIEDINHQMLKGVVKAYPHLNGIPNSGIIYQRNQDPATVPIISGGGSGHEPAHFGFVGKGMLTAAISGPIFVPPSWKEILQTIQLVHKGKGVFIIIKNFAEDLAEFSVAIKKARAEGIPIKYVIAHDDISIETSNYQVRHRGVAGTVFLHKILGEAAKNGASLDELEALALQLSTRIYTLGVAVSPASIPGNKKPLFELNENEIFYGIGIHGEPGYRKQPFISSEILANELINKLKMKFKWQEGDKFALMINNLGATPLMEQLVFFNDVMSLLKLDGLNIEYTMNGRYMTSLDMEGLSISLFALEDPSWLNYLKAETEAFAW
ncbi:DhaKLM operon coactivator DhaQ [Globicatella sulfidifaciens]|uniref:DhaKLM operon coactivator DhaQ n=1 Tax=Globicatella sulfidifaciens TaxID=136093 RepID=A0A7X8C436_9LACT|nr:DhaKLM operon coactivator DhaQ [Globicatella sulfidifaciens]NLJ18503.1 DhaKLM operon coactivator DhaQ [Globicatella sulfidifaciens]